jgi:hypothetical protein
MKTRKGSAIRALVRQKITMPSGLFFQTVLPQLLSHRAGPIRACVFVLGIGSSWAEPIAVIRSVSHLVLARFGLMPWLPNNANRKERAGSLLPDSLRFGFLGQPFYYHTRWFWQARSPARRPSRHRRDQKTFSAGPRSFNSKELWFPGSIPASGGQPVSDSRHGRITCKAYLSCINIKLKESRRLQSTHRALGPTPFLAGDGSQKFNSFSSAGWPVPETCVSRHSRTVRP